MSPVRVRVLRQSLQRREKRHGASTDLMLGLLGGVLAGFVGWSLITRYHRRALFHPQPLRRLAALGYLRAHPSVDSARLLRDYIRWERHPLLRRRARLALRKTERMLAS